MAEPKDTPQAAPAPPAPEPAPEPESPMDETIAGGRYLRDGVLVNAEGEPIDSKGNVKK
jgi:hypothetical protein